MRRSLHSIAGGRLGAVVLVASVAALSAAAAGCAGGRAAQRKALPLPTEAAQRGVVAQTAPPPSTSNDVGVLHVRTRDGAWRSLYWDKASESVGRPNDGWLAGARQLPRSGPGWVCKGPNTFGADETILLLTWAIAEVVGQYPGSVPVVIGDISREEGGPLPPHKSHQSGRDVDVGYYAAHNRPMTAFEGLDPSRIDGEKTWFLLERLLLTGQVQYVFMNYKVQEVVFDAALDSGWSAVDLQAIFQYPRGPRARRGLIRHAPGHDDHFHVRFRCPVGDERCES